MAYSDKQKKSTYQCYQDMKQRCLNTRHKAFKYYGERGINICESWVSSYHNFIEDMGIKPELMTLERKDNNEGYSKDNCIWATRTTQSRNTRATNREDSGVYFDKECRTWVAQITVNGKAFRIGSFKIKQDAINERKKSEKDYWHDGKTPPEFNGLQRNNTHGFKGISNDKRTGNWYAYIDVNGKRKHLGTFKSKEQAVKSRVDYEAHGIGE